MKSETKRNVGYIFVITFIVGLLSIPIIFDGWKGLLTTIGVIVLVFLFAIGTYWIESN